MAIGNCSSCDKLVDITKLNFLQNSFRKIYCKHLMQWILFKNIFKHTLILFGRNTAMSHSQKHFYPDFLLNCQWIEQEQLCRDVQVVCFVRDAHDEMI